jgi:uncharacterized protein YrrD
MNNKLDDLPIVSVQASRPIGSVSGYIIDPRNLHIVALYADNRASEEPLILHTSDIREFNSQGILIDHDEQLMERDGLVRLQEVVKFNFSLLDKPVETDDGRGVGKVSAFAFDSLTWRVMRLNVSQPLVRNMGVSELIIHRQQIVKVTDNKIIVDSTKIKIKEKFSLRRMLLGGKPALNADSIGADD